MFIILVRTENISIKTFEQAKADQNYKKNLNSSFINVLWLFNFCLKYFSSLLNEEIKLTDYLS